MCKQTKDNNMDMANILFEEWKFRLSQYWSITSKTVLINFVLFFIPYMTKAWQIDISRFPESIFPIAGIIFAICICFISTVEMNKINQIKNSLKEFIKKECCDFTSAYDYNNDNKLHHNIPVCICFMQIVIGVIVLVTLH